MSKTKILIVDDDTEILEICRKSLRSLPDAETSMEDQSLRAVERLERESPDLLLTDLYMPELSGIELLWLGRQRDPNLVALILTGRPSIEVAVECMRLGATDFITKPFLPEELLGAVQRIMAAKELSLKVTEDVYYARIYRSALELFRLSDWESGIKKKLDIASRMCDLLHREIANKRTELLELAIVLLILVEMVLFIARE